jgi:NAD(P)H-flavin reductase
MSGSATIKRNHTDAPMVPRLARVRRHFSDAPDVVTLEIEMADARPFDYAPGQFNMLTVFGVGEAAISISGAPNGARLIHTIRDVGAVSHALTRLQPGDQLGLRGPFGVGWPIGAAQKKDVLIIAGGLGLAPLRSVLYHIVAHRTQFGVVTLLYGARRPEDILYPSEVAHWRQSLEINVALTVDHADASWRGRVGVVTQLIDQAQFQPQNTLAMVCGPEVMMRFVASALVERAIDAQNIFLSMERNMKCAVGHCGHCQLGPSFICRDGPVFSYQKLRPLLKIKEL